MVPSKSVGSGYCGRGCQCCQPTLPPCQYGKSCGSGGKCRIGNTCPKGEKLVSGNCGSTRSCICCAPEQPTGTCPAPFRKRGSEYFYFHDTSKMNWDDALKHCKSLGGSLAEPANMDDFIAHIESSYSHMKYDIWLGATDRSVEQSWKWLSGGSVPSSLWPAWPGNQPSGDGDCMQIHYHGYSGFFLNDYWCHVKGYFVCECTPKVTTDCLGKCTTIRGSGTCKDTCGRGEVRLGSCPGGKCSCCRPRITSVCAGMCNVGNQRGYCSTDCRYPDFPALETQESRLSLIPAPSTCDKGCICCPRKWGPILT
ncbi:unnamed protein product, partial [Meganyctiphanes norvegica]